MGIFIETTITKRDRLRLYGLRAFLKSNPEKHDQKMWGTVPESELEPGHDDVKYDCGTKACVAGWTNVLCGDVFSARGRAPATQGGYYWVFNVVGPDGEDYPMGPRAMEHLGLSKRVSCALFHPDNGLKPLLKALKFLAEGYSDDEVIYYLTSKNAEIFENPMITL